MNLPAAIVSPPRLSRMRPMSLFAANGSIGMGLGTAPVPERLSLRRVISISADVPLVRTLWPRSVRTETYPKKGYAPRVLSGHRTGSSINICNQLRDRCRDIFGVVEQFDLASRFL